MKSNIIICLKDDFDPAFLFDGYGHRNLNLSTFSFHALLLKIKNIFSRNILLVIVAQIRIVFKGIY